MGIREELGGRLEEALNKAVDKHLNADLIKEQLYSAIDDMVDKFLGELNHKLKADVIDLIDGEDDIK